MAIDLVVVDAYDLCESNNTFGWVTHSTDLSAYAGQTVSLRIQVETDSRWDSSVYIDDMALAAAPLPASAATVARAAPEPASPLAAGRHQGP